MVGSERNDPVELAVEERVARDNQRAKVLNDDGRECIFEIAFAAGVEDMDRLVNSTSRNLHIAQRADLRQPFRHARPAASAGQGKPPIKRRWLNAAPFKVAEQHSAVTDASAHPHRSRPYRKSPKRRCRTRATSQIWCRGER